MALFLYSLLLSGALSLPAQSILVPANLTAKVKFNKLTPGTVLETTLDQPVYDGASQLLPAGSRLQLTLASITKQKPHITTLRRIGALATGSPLPKPDYKITLRSATLLSPDGRQTPVNAEVLSLTIQRRLLAKGQTLSATPQPSAKLVLRLTGLASSQSASPVFATAAEIPAGTKARILLLKDLRASQTKPGDPLEAQLLEPLRLDSGAVIPAGTLLAGSVTAAKGPRRVFRPASLRLGFNSLRLPDGRALPIATVLSSAYAEKGAGASLDSEGGLSGGPASKLRLAVDVGLAYASGKLIDDIFEEGVKAGVGSAAAGSAATTARYIGLATGAVFLLLQRGNDVHLPQYTELELTFARPLTIR